MVYIPVLNIVVWTGVYLGLSALGNLYALDVGLYLCDLDLITDSKVLISPKYLVKIRTVGHHLLDFAIVL